MASLMYLHRTFSLLYRVLHEQCPLQIVRLFDCAQGKLGEASRFTPSTELRTGIRAAGWAQILRCTQTDYIVLNRYEESS